MAFIISKISKTRNNSKILYYLVENYRDGKKIKRRKISTLGEYCNLTDLLENLQKEENSCLAKIMELEGRLIRIKNGDLKAFLPYCPPYRQVARITERISNLKANVNELKLEENKTSGLIAKYPKCSANKT